MAKIGTGIDGSITFATGYNTNVDTWTMSAEAAEHDVTDFASTGWKEFIIGLKEFSGSYTAFVDDTAQLDANVNWFGGTLAAATFALDATRTMSGNILITGWTIDTATTDSIKVTFNYRGTGALAVN